jgi:hypothetical protein
MRTLSCQLPPYSTAVLRGFIGHVAHPIPFHCDGAIGGRKFRPMGHNKGKDNARKRAKRRQKAERLVLLKKKQTAAK